MKGLKITMGPLLPWKKHSVEIKRAAVDALKEMKAKYPGIKQISRPPSLSFTKDNVHLTDRAAKMHFKAVYTGSYETFFNKEDEYLTEDEGAEKMDLNQGEELEFSARKNLKKRQKED